MRASNPLKVALAIAFSCSVLTAYASGTSLKSRKLDFETKVLELTNRERAKAGLGPLALADRLSNSAEWKAEDMADRNYFDHADGNGRDFVDRADQYGYGDWTYLGENIAAGQRTPEEVVAEWMASPGHRKNILKPQFKEIGLGYADDPHSSYKRYWVQEFGTR
ncbi:MAG TPA: CAP domain-containing protein [Fimbriimonadaceae bacterium]|jgi:uncharacterized protein YkwD